MKTLTLIALIAATAGCAGAPQLRNVSLQADVSTQIGGDVSHVGNGVNYHGGHVGRIGVVFDQPIAYGLSYRLGLEHISLLDTNSDRGEERASVGFTWRPFR